MGKGICFFTYTIAGMEKHGFIEPYKYVKSTRNGEKNR